MKRKAQKTPRHSFEDWGSSLWLRIRDAIPKEARSALSISNSKRHAPVRNQTGARDIFFPCDGQCLTSFGRSNLQDEDFTQ